jgi:hypothetical protein
VLAKELIRELFVFLKSACMAFGWFASFLLGEKMTPLGISGVSLI